MSASLPPAPDGPVKTRRRSVTWPVAAAGVVIALVAGIAIGYGSAQDSSDDASAASSPTESPVASPTVESPSPLPSPSPIPSPSPAGNLTRQDIELSLKTTERQCFGSAGCNVTVEVRAAIDQAVLDALPRDGTWDVTYQISGDESGPLIGTFSMYGNGKYDVNEEFLSTPSANTPIRVKALEVERF